MIYHHGRATVQLVKVSRRYRDIVTTGTPVPSRRRVPVALARAEFRATCALVRERAKDENGRVLAVVKSFRGVATMPHRGTVHISRKGRKSYRSKK